jgi:hypothetical protein
LTAHLGAVMYGDQYGVSRDPDPAIAFFHDYLERLRTDYVDVLFLHNSNTQEDLETLMGEGGFLSIARRFVEAGKARAIGFSGHNAVTARQAVESGAIDVVMFPVNLASHTMPGHQALFRACAAHDVALVAMKPYAGGNLLRPSPTMVIEDFQLGRTELPGAPSRFEKPDAITPVQCLSYVLAQPGVATAVPGCKNVAELEAALAYWDASPAARAFDHLLPAFEGWADGACVYCNHCLPCPAGIDIGKVMSLYAQLQGRLPPEVQVPDVRAAYAELAADGAAAADCIACGACADRCPFEVEVVAQMAAVAAAFASATS